MVIYDFIDSRTGGDSGQEDISDIVELVGSINGARGGADSADGGMGAALDVTVDISGFDDLYWNVGGQGFSNAGGENGGGAAASYGADYTGAGGGGSTDIRVTADVEGTRIVVAGGGGGAGNAKGTGYAGGNAGLLNGDDGEENPNEPGAAGGGGITEDDGGGFFAEFEGQAADANQAFGGAGGGGYWSGGAGRYGSGGGGGASHVDGIVKNYSTAYWGSDDGAIILDAREAAASSPFVQESAPYFAGRQITIDADIFEGYYNVSSVSWDLDDGTTKSGEIVTHTYENSGTYTAEVTIVDSEGYETVESFDITVENPVDPSFTYNTPVTQGFDTTFTDGSTVDPDATIDDEFWRVGGSRESSNTDLTYSFGAPGQIIVEKVFEAYGNEYTYQSTVDVQPAADVSFSYTSPVVANIQETFVDETTVVSGANKQSEEWVIDGVIVGENQNLDYTFTSSGTYAVGKVVTVNGYDYSSGQSVTVEQNTTADFSFSPSQPLVNEQINFTDESVTPFNITSYSWDFGDGTTSTNQNPSNTYTDRGEYNVQLTVEDDQGQTDSTAQIVTVFSRKPTVETELASNIGDFEATLEGRLIDVGVDSSADVYFEYRETGASTWNQTSIQSLSETGTFSETVTGLSIETEYEYRAVGENSEGVLTASTVTFSTDTNTAPTVDAFSITPDPITRDTAVDVQVDASDEVGIDELLVEWYYEGSLQTSQTFTYSSATSISETLTGFYTPTQFGNHQVAITLTDSKGLQQTDTINQSLDSVAPSTTLTSPSDGITIQYNESYNYRFDVSTGNAAATDIVLVVIDSNNNRVQENSVGSLAVDSGDTYSVQAQQIDAPGDYQWGVEIDYETSNFVTSNIRSLTVAEPSEVSVETGDIVSGGYGLLEYGDEGYGEDSPAKGFNFINAEGGLIFTGDSDFLDLYFQYRKTGESAWKETGREKYDNTGGS